MHCSVDHMLNLAYLCYNQEKIVSGNEILITARSESLQDSSLLSEGVVAADRVDSARTIQTEETLPTGEQLLLLLLRLLLLHLLLAVTTITAIYTFYTV